jgi:DNA-binding NarL/FixJ family response regulator
MAKPCFLPPIQRSLRGLKPQSLGASDLIQPLSDREIEVLRLVATGFPTAS